MLRILVISILGLVAGAPLDQQQSSCEVCHLLMNELQDYLTTSQSKASIENYVTDICSRLAGAEKDICLDFTRNYAGSFFTKLDSDLTPSQICDSIPEVCPIEEKQDTNEDVQGPLECAICELAVLGIDKIVKTNRSEAAINAALEKFCSGLPSELSGPCKKIEPEILKGLSQGFNPKIACRFAKLCLVAEDDVIRNIPCDVCHAAIDAMGITDTGSVCKHLEACETQTETETETELETEPSVEADAGCEICELVVTFIDQLIEDNATAGAINSTLIKLCDALPTNVKPICLGVVPTIIAALANGVDPNQACIATNFCPSGAQSNSCDLCTRLADSNKDGKLNELVLDTTCTKLCHSRQRRSAPVHSVVGLIETMLTPCREEHNKCKDAACDACKLVVSGLNALVGSNITTGAVNKTMADICGKLAGDSVKDMCLKAVPKIVKLFQNGVSPGDACKVAGLCTSVPTRSSRKRMGHSHGLKKIFHKVKSETIKLTGNPIDCILCKELGQAINFLLADNNTETGANSTLYNICINLPADNLKAMCLSAVPKLLQALEHGLNVSDVCVKAKMCPAISTEEMSFEEKVRLFEPSTGSSKVNLYCDICELMVKELDKVLEDNSTRDEINSTVYDICDKLEGAFKNLCLQSAPPIIDAIVNGVSPKEVCTLIKLCDAKQAVKETPKLKQVDLLCDTCKFVIEELDKVLDENSTLDQINATVYGACAKLKGALLDLCLLSAPKIVDAVHTGVDPKLVCSLVKACSAGKEALKETPNSKQVDLICDTCKFVIVELDKILDENTTLDKINSTVYGACATLKGAFLDLCLQSAPKIVEAVHSGVDPQQVCSLTKLCPAGKDAGIQNQYPVSDNLKDIKCDICELAIKEIDAILQRNSTGQDIKAIVDGVCNKLKGTLQTLCLNIAPDVVKALEAGVEPELACKILRICTGFSADAELENLSPVSDNLKDIKCDICELAIKEIDAILQRNSTGQDIKAIVDGVCNKLKGTLQTLCLNIAPDVVKALEAGVEPELACKILRICTSFSADAELENLSPVSDNLKDLKCDVCEFAIKEIDAILQRNGTGQDVNATVFGVCAKLPGTLESLCNTAAPEIVKALTNGVDPDQACAIIKICTSTEKSIPSLSETSGNLKDIKCDICELAIKEIDAILQRNSTGQDIKAIVDGVCNKLKGTLQTLCLNIAPDVVKALEAGVEPELACKILRICTSFSADAELENLSPVSDNLKDLKCDVCEFAIKEIDAILQRNGTGQDVNATVFGVCAKLPGTLESLCNTAAPEIVKALTNGVDPDQACAIIKICTSTEKSIPLLSETSGNLKDLKCDICELAIKEIDAILKRNGTGEDINSTVYGVCDKLPGSLQTLCYNIAPNVVKAISSGVDPEQACAAIKVCTSFDTNELLVSESESNLKDIKCDICEFAIKEIVAVIKNGSGGDYNSTVYGVCDKLTGVLKTFCDQYAPQIVKALQSGVDPNKTCVAIKLCSSTDTNAFLISKSEDNLKDLKCDICEFAIKEIDAIIKRNGTGEDINSTVYGVCDGLPGSLQTLCYNIAPNVVKALSSGVDPEQACAAIKVCTSFDTNELLVSESENNLKDIKCDICEFAIKEIVAVIKNGSGGDYNSTVYGVCDKLTGVLKTFCDQYAPQIVKALQSGVDPNKTCVAIKLCSSTDTNAFLISKSEDNLKDLKCDICEFAIKEIDAIIKRNGTGEDINSTVYGVCDGLPGSLQTLCYNIAPNVVKALSSGVDPEQACAAIKVCTSFDTNELLVSESENNLKDIKCDICEFAIKEIVAVIKNGSGGDYNSTVYGVCDKLTGVLKSFCYQYAPQIVKALQSGVDPNKTCVAIKLCSSTAVNTVGLGLSGKQPLDCMACQNSLQKVYTNVQQDYPKVQRVLEQLCEKLSPNLHSTCKAVLEADNGVVFKTLLQGYTPVLMCEMAECVEG